MKVFVFIIFFIAGVQVFAQAKVDCSKEVCVPYKNSIYVVKHDSQNRPYLTNGKIKITDPNIVSSNITAVASVGLKSGNISNNNIEKYRGSLRGIDQLYINRYDEYLGEVREDLNRRVDTSKIKKNTGRPSLYKVKNLSVIVYDQSGKVASKVAVEQYLSVYGETDSRYCVSVKNNKCDLYVDKLELSKNASSISSTAERGAYPVHKNGTVTVFKDPGKTYKDSAEEAPRLAWPKIKDMVGQNEKGDKTPDVEEIVWHKETEIIDAKPVDKYSAYAKVKVLNGNDEEVEGYIKLDDIAAKDIKVFTPKKKKDPKKKDKPSGYTTEVDERILEKFCGSFQTSCNIAGYSYGNVKKGICKELDFTETLKVYSEPIFNKLNKCLANSEFSKSKPYFVKVCDSKTKILVEPGSFSKNQKTCYTKTQVDKAKVESPYLSLVEGLSKDSKVKKNNYPDDFVFNGKLLSADQLKAIDVLARTTFREMDSCFRNTKEKEITPEYPMAVLKSFQSRVDALPEKLGLTDKLLNFTVLGYKNEKHYLIRDIGEKYGFGRPTTREGELAAVAGSRKQYSVWNYDDSNLERMVCPETDSLNQKLLKQSYALATLMVLNEDVFDEQTKELEGYTHYLSIAALAKGKDGNQIMPAWYKQMNHATSQSTRVLGRPLTEINKCVQLYKK